MAERQRDFLETFDYDARNHAARQQLIEGLPIGRREQTLLKALDSLATSRRVKPEPDGAILLSVPLEVLRFHLDCSRNTLRACIDSVGGTPFLVVTPSQHGPHNYLLRWPVIVDHSRPVGETTVGACQQDATAHACDQDGVIPVRRPVRGSIRTPEGVKTDTARGSIRGGQLGVNLTPRQPVRGSTGGGQGGQTPAPRGSIDPGQKGGWGVKTPGFLISESKNKDPGLSPESAAPARNSSEGVNAVRSGFWQRWRTEIAVRDLSRPEDVQELYQLAVAEGLCSDSEQNRLRVFAQAAHDRRVARTPKAVFRENVAKARWLCSHDDEELAAEMIATLAGCTDGPRTADLLAEAERGMSESDASRQRFREFVMQRTGRG